MSALSRYSLLAPHPRPAIAALGLVFLIVHATLWYIQGVELGLEADKYISQGEILLREGRLSESKFIFYLPVILLVSAAKALGLPLYVVAIVQILFSAYAQYVFYKLMRKLSSNATAFLASLILLLFIPLQAWNLFLYSDSIFISFSLLFAYTIYNYRPTRLKTILPVLLVLCGLVFSRPSGILFIPATIIYILLLPQDRRTRVIIAVGSITVLVLMYLSINTIFSGGSDMDVIKPYVEEHVICFVPQKPEGSSLTLLNSGDPVKDLFYYVVHNPLHFLRMVSLRMLSFFNLCRPYYSSTHNLLLIAFMVPMYLFSIAGILKTWRRTKPFVLFIALFVVLYSLGIALQCDDWHSRFTMVVIPYFIYLAAAGFMSLKPFRHLQQP
jgi:4-amino-4-deoxy-L-arabinose transferase-like glycosyltransferase